MPRQSEDAEAVCEVHTMPSEEVRTVFVPTPITTNRVSSGDHSIDHHDCAGTLILVHAIPSGEVIILLVPSLDTATNNPTSAAHITFLHDCAGAVLAVHVIPSCDVNTLLVPPDATDTIRFNAGDHAVEVHVLLLTVAACVCSTQVTLDGSTVDDDGVGVGVGVGLLDSLTLGVGVGEGLGTIEDSPVMNCVPDATSIPKFFAHITLIEKLLSAIALGNVVQTIPSGEVNTRRAPVLATTTNKPSSAAHVTSLQPYSGIAIPVQLIESLEVIIFGPVPELETATSLPSSADHAIEVQLTPAKSGVLTTDQLIPSGEVMTRPFPPLVPPTATNNPNSSAHVTETQPPPDVTVGVAHVIPSVEVNT